MILGGCIGEFCGLTNALYLYRNACQAALVTPVLLSLLGALSWPAFDF